MLPKNKNFTKYSLILIICCCLLLPLVALATTDYGQQTAAETAGFASGSAYDIPMILGRFAGGALALSGSIFLFLIVYGGIIIMTAAGKQEKIQKGKDIIVWAIIGAIILGGAYAITNLVFSVFQR